MTNPDEQIIIDFCTAWEQLRLDDILEMMSPDIVYQNVPRPPMIGIEETRKFIEPILKNVTKIDFIILNIATSSASGIVLTERMDRLYFPKGVVEIPIMGTFKLNNHKIVEWKDYADSAHVADQMSKI